MEEEKKKICSLIAWSDNPVKTSSHGDGGARMDNTPPQGRKSSV